MTTDEKLAELRELYARYMAETTTYDPPSVDEMPSLDPPGNDAGAHLVVRANPEAGTLCGAARNHTGHTVEISDGRLVCACGAAICPTCHDLAVAMVRYGGRLP